MADNRAMDFQADEETVVRPQTPAAARNAADRNAADRNAADRNAATIVTGRLWADAPIEALANHSTPPSVLAAVDLVATLPMDYAVRINTSTPVSLDMVAVIGRNPALPRIMQGSHPRLIRVPSPLKEVSNTHLELRQQGALVIITDLRTTNGSVVKVPGLGPVKLRQGESLVVIAGTIVEIGDGNVIEILPLQRAEPTERSFE